MCFPHTSQFLLEGNCRPYLNPTKRPSAESFLLELLHWTPRLSQRYSCSWVMGKIYVLWGNDSRELIFCHPEDVTLKYFGFRVYTLNNNARLPQINEFKSNTMQKSQNKLKTKINPRKIKHTLCVSVTPVYKNAVQSLCGNYCISWWRFLTRVQVSFSISFQLNMN